MQISITSYIVKCLSNFRRVGVRSLGVFCYVCSMTEISHNAIFCYLVDMMAGDTDE